MNLKAGIYVRVSTEEQRDYGYSIDGHWFLKYCKENNCAIDFLYENYDINTPNGEMLYGMNVLFVQRERREIAGRTKRGMEEAVRQGKYPSRAPYGYQKDEDYSL